MDNKNSAAIYVRLSKEDIDSLERESESIQNQKSMLLSYAASRQWQVFDVYCDEDYSGAYAGGDNNRPQFNRMIADAAAGRFGIVLCKSQSRFSRNMEVIERYIHGRFPEWGVRFVGLVDNADTEIKGNKKARQINSLINEWYLEDLSENVKAVFRDKMLRGEFLGSFPPYGYSKDTENKNHLVPNPKTAPIVRQIFEWRGDGYGAVKIARMLNERGIPTPRKQQELDGLRKTYMYAPEDMGKWSTTSVGDILNNPVYCGDVAQHTREKVSYKSKVIRKVEPERQIVIRNMHIPIVSRELFERVQTSLRSCRSACGDGKVHILSGKVFCHYCGKPMQKNHSKSTNGGDINYLRCRDKYAYESSHKCPTPNVRIDRILSALQMQLIEQFKDTAIDGLDDNTVRKILTLDGEKEDILKAELRSIEEEKVKKEMCLRNLYSDRLNGVITLEQYMSFSESFSKRVDEINARIAEIESKLKSGDEVEMVEVKMRVKQFLETKNIDRQIIDSLVDRIEFGEFNPETNRAVLKIFWAWE